LSGQHSVQFGLYLYALNKLNPRCAVLPNEQVDSNLIKRPTLARNRDVGLRRIIVGGDAATQYFRIHVDIVAAPLAYQIKIHTIFY